MIIPDYSQYSFRQLYEALDSLRGDAYPEALAALEEEIARRDDPDKTELEEVYFRLNADQHPEHASRLRAAIEAHGGFDTIAPEVVTDENRFRTGWRRFWAMLVFDPLVFAVGFSIITAPFGRAAADNPAVQTALNFAADVGWIFYFVLLHAICGQTVGKMITGVKVVRNSDLGPIRLWHALAREIGPLLIFVVAMLILPGVDFIEPENAEEFIIQLPPSIIALIAAPFIWGMLEILTMLFNKRRRALHDFIAGTVVIRHVRPRKRGRKSRVPEETVIAS